MPQIDPATDEPRSRVAIEGVEPELDCGKFAAKAIAGEPFLVEADVLSDGHDAVRCVLLYRSGRQRKWREAEMELLGNDRWRGRFEPDSPGEYVYTLRAWVDTWGTWVRDLRKRVGAGQDVAVDLRIGAGILEGFAEEKSGRPGRDLRALAERLRRTADHPEGEATGPTASGDEAATPDRTPAAEESAAARADEPSAPDLADLLDDLEGEAGRPAREHDPRRFATTYEKELRVFADRERAAFSAWYEFFPRSTGEGGEHGTFETAARMLDYVAELGFDIVYLPPIHPIGRTKRKGPNNDPAGGPEAIGSPWAIGAEEGGHTAVHPDLGTLDDFRRFRERAEALGLEVALDVAFQVAPDHPWVARHPEWFRKRPDGTIQYAENPPKKYQDIYPISFETEAWASLWAELKGVFDFWIGEGVKVFRVDNPHTKSFRFWAWCIAEIRRRHPDVILLSEAFTRPRVMYHLAKLGFTQSYTYFAWRGRPDELRAYLEELTRGQPRHYFRPNFWPNTPDILTETLQHGGRGAFAARFVLAATLTASYGVYGPAFELLEHRPAKPGSEEYLDSEKYQIRRWDLGREDSLRHLIARVNRIRREHPALHRDGSLRFHGADNPTLLAYSKRAGMPVPPGRPDVPAVPEEGPPGDTILCVVSTDPHHRQAGWTDLDMDALGLEEGATYQVHDLLSDARYHWHGRRNYVELDPHTMPAHVFRIVRRSRTEEDFRGEG